MDHGPPAKIPIAPLRKLIAAGVEIYKRAPPVRRRAGDDALPSGGARCSSRSRPDHATQKLYVRRNTQGHGGRLT